MPEMKFTSIDLAKANVYLFSIKASVGTSRKHQTLTQRLNQLAGSAADHDCRGIASLSPGDTKRGHIAILFPTQV